MNYVKWIIWVSGALALCGVENTAYAETESVAGVVETTTSETQPSQGFPITFNYTNIFYGPALEKTTSYQPTGYGASDSTRPVFMKNLLSASYDFNPDWAVSATAYWWYRPVQGQSLTLQNPFLRVSDAGLVRTDWGLNWYGDVRVHFGVSADSRAAQEIGGVQNFNYLTYQPGYWRFIAGLREYVWYHAHRATGYGTDWEMYVAPEANFRLSRSFALTALYEMGASHQFGDSATNLGNDGTDLEPGIEWDPSPDIVVNPYVTIQTGGAVSWRSTSVGMFFTWSFL